MKRSSNRDIPLTSRQHELVEGARAVILHVAGTLARKHRGQRLEDLVGWCEDGAIAAAQDYRENDGEAASFTTFAWPRIWGSAKNAVTREKRTAAIGLLEDRASHGRAAAAVFASAQRDTGNPLHDTEEDEERQPREALDGFAMAYLIGFSLAGPPDSPETQTLHSELRASLATLKDRDETVVRLHVVEQQTFAEIARELPGQPAEATVKRHYREAMVRLGKRLAKKKG